MGVQPFLVASSLVALQAQRLIRRVCKHCAKPHRPIVDELHDVGIDPDLFFGGEPALKAPVKDPQGNILPLVAPEGRTLPPPGMVYEANGCEHCGHSGYSGRTGVYEVLPITEEVRRLAIRNADASEIKAAAIAEGMRTLRDDGAHKVLTGMTTIEEVMRVTAEEA
jgi:general secretion pathway protein E